MIPYGRHTISSLDAIRVGWQVRFHTLTQGKQISEFEEEVANFVGARFAVAVSSATAGLHIAMLALNLPTNARVVTTPISFVATANSVSYCGLRPVFVDIEPNSLTLDLDAVQKKISQDAEIKAVITVHYAGLPDDAEKLGQLRKSTGIYIIEDAAHSFGARYSTGELVGSCQNSDMTVFSFHPVKSFTTGEGGIVTTNSEDLYRTLLRLRSHGINKLESTLVNSLAGETNGQTNPWYYEMLNLGFNYRLTEIQAVLGRSQLSRIGSFIEARRKIARFYIEGLNEFENVSIAQKVNTSWSAHHLFPIRISFDKISDSRRDVMMKLKKMGIGTQVHYIPIPLQPFYAQRGHQIAELPHAIEYYEQALSIPMFPKLRKSGQRRVLQALKIVVG